ncbi:MAG: hypothetical protein B7Y40_11185 [Gammaproteobacteria bacterium 28-57-27]|nr:MAG: hypothetical protein B7Y40_11185 [Gammaproteobacteria bacterium 28-57-27]
MSDFLVVGAGAIGMLTALALRARGYAVTLLDRQQAGQESSWAGGGILSPLYPWHYADAVNALAQRSQQLYPALAERLLADTGVDPELLSSGLLMLDDVAGQDAASVSRVDPLVWANARGVVLQRVHGDAVPGLQAGITDAGGDADSQSASGACLAGGAGCAWRAPAGAGRGAGSGGGARAGAGFARVRAGDVGGCGGGDGGGLERPLAA